MFSSQVAPNLVDSRKHNAYSNKSNNISIMSVSSAHVADLAGICFFKKEKINTLQLEHMQFFKNLLHESHILWKIQRTSYQLHLKLRW